MDEQIKRITERNHPQLFAQMDLPILARVVAISDPLPQEALSERFRPRYAVDVQVLRPNGTPDELLPVFRAVPLPMVAAGLERGAYGFPEAGTIVEIAFAWGLPDRPFIRTILGQGLSLPGIEQGELLLQAGPGVFQRADTAGNWLRQTDADIVDDCAGYALDCWTMAITAQQAHQVIKQDSTEEITGKKIIEALGAIKLLSAGGMHIGAVDNLNLTTASDHNNKIGRDLKQSVGQNVNQDIANNITQRIGNIVDSLADVKQLIKVKNGGTVWLGSEGENVLQILSDLIDVVADIANTASSHTHQYTDNGSPLTTQPPIQAGTFSGQKGQANDINGRLTPIIEG